MFPISPLRYPGGKARLAPTIAAIMKSAGFGDDVVFVEPFAGGAGAGLTLLFQNRVKTLVLNDFDKAIAAFWTAILNETERFVDAIRTVPLDLDERSRKDGGKSAFIATTRRRSSNGDSLHSDATRRSFTSTRLIFDKARGFTVKRSTKPTIAVCATQFFRT